MKPIPIKFNIGPLQIHTYGIGLAITFWVAYRYFSKRLKKHGYDDAWLGRAFVWIIAAAIVGARAVSVIANLGHYTRNPGDILAVWQGGLSSYGGLLFGVPTGLYLAHRWARELRLSVAADIVAPVLAFAWALGRLLGPQMMYSGGGNPTTAWYGMQYAGETGKRVPVPIFQSIECFVVWGIALLVEKQVRKHGGPVGLVTTAVVTFYGAARFFDEYVLLPHGPGGVAVEGASLAFVGAGLALMGLLVWRDKRRRPVAGLDADGAVADPWAAPTPAIDSPPDGDDGRLDGAEPADGDEGRVDAAEPAEADQPEAFAEAGPSEPPMVRAGDDHST